jgi:UDP-N-acetylglucosamine 1-carboxyvinyltransferase
MLTITGGAQLSGSVTISGSKNAAAPIIAGALLFESSTLHNVPRIGDVFNLLEIIASFGVEIEFTGNTLQMKWKEGASDSHIDRERMKKIRISILLLPALLQKFGRAEFPFPGGCNIGKRPIGEHISGLQDLGYELSNDGEMMCLRGDKKSGEIELYANRMVTATENLLSAAVLREGVTLIRLAAYEPHVIDLIHFYQSSGIKIDIGYDHTIRVEGVDTLPEHIEYRVTTDYLESGTFVIAGALAAWEYIDIKNAGIPDLRAFLERLHKAGVVTQDRGDDTLRVHRATELRAIDLQGNIFPGVPSDLGSPFWVLLTQAEWISKVHEVLYEGRFGYLGELEKMKAHVAILNPHEALIFGPTSLRGATVSSWDLRAGAAMILAGLIADGQTQITNVEYIDRGYEDIVGKLIALGAHISRSTTLN